MLQLSGFADQNSGGKVTTNKITLPIKFDDIRDNWEKLNDIAFLKVNPFATINITRISSLSEEALIQEFSSPPKILL